MNMQIFFTGMSTKLMNFIKDYKFLQGNCRKYKSNKSLVTIVSF